MGTSSLGLAPRFSAGIHALELGFVADRIVTEGSFYIRVANQFSLLRTCLRGWFATTV